MFIDEHLFGTLRSLKLSCSLIYYPPRSTCGVVTMVYTSGLGHSCSCHHGSQVTCPAGTAWLAYLPSKTTLKGSHYDSAVKQTKTMKKSIETEQQGTDLILCEVKYLSLEE